VQDVVGRQNEVPGRLVIRRLHVIDAGQARVAPLVIQNWRHVGVVSPCRAMQARPSAQSSPVCIWPDAVCVQVAPAVFPALLPHPSEKVTGV